MKNYVFYDTETTGTDPRFDQVLQFAAILTDEDFNEIDYIDVRCRLLPYMVPAPMALLVTGVKPAQLSNAELSHYEMVRFIHEKLEKWAPAIFCGFNTIQFDEEIIRQMFWECLLDPYITTAKGSSRVDLLKILEVANTAQPGIIKTALTEKGNVSFKLDKIAPLNGFAGHNAHDALGDVRATIFMAKMLKEKAPAIFEHEVMMGDSKLAINLVDNNRVLHYMTHFGKPFLYEVGVVAHQPSNPKSVLVFNLQEDPTPYLQLAPEVLADKIMDPKTPLKVVRLNAQPALFEPGTSPFSIDIPTEIQILVDRVKMVTEASFVERAEKALEIRGNSYPEKTYLEERIYEGFASRDDKTLMSKFHYVEDWVDRRSLVNSFQDERTRQLARRLIYCEAPDAMTDDEAMPMEAAVIANRLLNEDDVPYNTYPKALAEVEKLEIKPDPRFKTEDLAEIKAYLENGQKEAEARLAFVQSKI